MVVSIGIKESIRKWQSKYQISLSPVLLDPDKVLYRSLGLRRRVDVYNVGAATVYSQRMVRGIPFPTYDWEGDDILMMAGDFITQADGELVYAYYQERPSVWPSVEELLKALQK